MNKYYKSIKKEKSKEIKERRKRILQYLEIILKDLNKRD
jgi:hypothetical protein